MLSDLCCPPDDPGFYERIKRIGIFFFLILKGILESIKSNKTLFIKNLKI